MKHTKLFIYTLLTAIMLFGTIKSSFASGFPVRPGRLIISPSVSYFFANKQWDSVGTKKPFADNGKFTSITYSLYAEYGISRRFSAVFLLPYITNQYEDNSRISRISGLTDMETGLKYYLANINYVYYFSIQGTAITPLYSDKNLGYAEEGAELKLSFAGSGMLFNRNFFFNVDNGVRQYFGDGGPLQDRYTGTFGITLDNKFKNQLSLTVGGIYTTSNMKSAADTTSFNVLNPYANKDFSFTEASISYGHSFNKRLTVFVTGSQFLIGRNTSIGTSGTIALVYRIGN